MVPTDPSGSNILPLHVSWACICLRIKVGHWRMPPHPEVNSNEAFHLKSAS